MLNLWHKFNFMV